MASARFFSGGGRFKELVRKYGKVALGVHLSVSAASITGIYVAIKSNVDVETMLENIGMGAKSSEDQPKIEQSHSEQHPSNDLESMLENIGMGPKTSEDQPQIERSHSEQRPSNNGGDRDFVSSGGLVQGDGSADQQLQKKKNRTAEMAASGGGALALALLCNKALFPIRVPITIALTPPIARFLRARNIIKNVV